MKIEIKEKQKWKEGFVRRERERIKLDDLLSVSCLEFYINSIWCLFQTIVPFPVCICNVSSYLWILIVLHVPLPNFFICEGTEKKISVLLYDLCAYGLVCLLQEGCVRVSQSHRLTEPLPGGLHS